MTEQLKTNKIITLYKFLFNLVYFIPLWYARILLLLKLWLMILWPMLHLELCHRWILITCKWDSLNTENIVWWKRNASLMYSSVSFSLKICRNKESQIVSHVHYPYLQFHLKYHCHFLFPKLMWLCLKIPWFHNVSFATLFLLIFTLMFYHFIWV